MDNLIVNLGGVGTGNGEITVNIDPEMKPDIVCDITEQARELEKHFEMASVDTFLCIHTLEHFEPKDAISSMAYWHEFLKPCGKLLIVVPDMLAMMTDCVQKGIDPEVFLSVAYGRNNLFFAPNQWGMHRWGWTDATLRRDMLAAGFMEVREANEQTYREFWPYNYEGFRHTGQVGKYQVRNLRLIGWKL